MRNIIAFAALALSTIAQPACLWTRPYEPLRIALRAPSVVRAEAIREFALDEDLYVVRRTGHWSEVELVSRPHNATRSRIAIDNRADPIAVSFWTEVRGRSGEWRRSDVVCAEYSHAREREVARRIQTLIRRQMLL